MDQIEEVILLIYNGVSDSEDVNDKNTIERGISTHTNITDEYAATTLTIVGLHDNHDIVVGCQMIT